MIASGPMDFRSPTFHGFIRVATATPAVAPADIARNTDGIVDLAHRAAAEGAALVIYPELCITGYSNDDLFFQETLLRGAENAVARCAAATATLPPLLAIGAPVRIDGAIYNSAVILQRGRILGIVPKRFLPNYREFYEKRQFNSGELATRDRIRFAGQDCPFGLDLLFEASDLAGFVLHAEICEDAWVPVPPSAHAALAGATILANLSASNVTVGKSDFRHALCRVHSARAIAAYIYSAAGQGESTTDLAWDGHAMIYENGELLAESERFASAPLLTVADVDLERLLQERSRLSSFHDNRRMVGESALAFRRLSIELAPSMPGDVTLRRTVNRFPFVPSDPARLNELCYEAYNIQVFGLKRRLEASGISRLVIGISGGLDSTQALLVACKTFDLLGLPRTNILCYTLPGFATSLRTKENAWALMRAFGVSAEEIDIGPVCLQTLRDLKHPFADGKQVYDVTFENVQAGARTALLFRLANQKNALVLGTGDLSELALGWCTYGVGDHMSHYNVNASVPKTLIQHLIRWVIASGHFGDGPRPVLQDILDTEISPELIPGDAEKPSQSTEATIGPYELHDFTLYYATRFGFGPRKIAFLALHAWGDASRGSWPAGLTRRNAYDLATIKRHLAMFVRRFFQNQFKRSALPNGPKVLSGGSLSPRGDWRMPSDASAAAWLAEIDSIPER